MKTVYRYPLTPGGVVVMPVGARPISVGPPRTPGAMDLWAIVDPDVDDTEARTFRIVGTGHPMPPDCESFIGTVNLADEGLIFHVFDTAVTE